MFDLQSHAGLVHCLISSASPTQLVPKLHVLVRLSGPDPQVTEQDHDDHSDQAVVLYVRLCWVPL